MRLSTRIDLAAILASLPNRSLNYSAEEIDASWTRDTHHHLIGQEAPGPPEPGGIWQRARNLVRDYQFTPPGLVRAYYRLDTELDGRDMLLQGRFLGLRFLMPVRITRVHDHHDTERTVFGWAYETLHGHLERGRVDYELTKHHARGTIEFTARSLWQLNPRAHPLIRLGWALFGRHTQRRFYRGIETRLGELARSPVDIVEVPTRIAMSRGLIVLDAAGDHT